MTTRSSFALSRYATTARFGLRLRCLAGSETSYQLSSHSLEGRQRVGLTPDLLLRFPTPDGVSDCLGELKAMYRGRMKSRRTDGRGSFRQLIGAHLKGLTGSTLGRHQATQGLWWQGFRVMATCSVWWRGHGAIVQQIFTRWFRYAPRARLPTCADQLEGQRWRDNSV